MSRPKKNNLDYFSHDNGMRNDRKIKALRAKFGNQGYAIFNMLLETLCESELLLISLNETELELISGDLNIVSEELTQIIDYLLQIGLLQKSGNYIFCKQLDMRSQGVFDKRTHNLDSLRKINGVNISKTGVSESESTQSKVKESKGKRKKKFTPPSLDEFKEFFKEKGYKEDIAEKAWNGYNEANWHDSKGSPVLNWKQKCYNVWFKDEHKAPGQTVKVKPVNIDIESQEWATR